MCFESVIDLECCSRRSNKTLKIVKERSKLCRQREKCTRIALVNNWIKISFRYMCGVRTSCVGIGSKSHIPLIEESIPMNCIESTSTKSFTTFHTQRSLIHSRPLQTLLKRLITSCVYLVNVWYFDQIYCIQHASFNFLFFLNFLDITSFFVSIERWCGGTFAATPTNFWFFFHFLYISIQINSILNKFFLYFWYIHSFP